MATKTKTPAKQPEDHKPKKTTTKTVTVGNIVFEVDPGIFDDLDLLDAMDQVQEGNALRLAGALRAVTGDRYREIRDALRDPETGRVPIEPAMEFFSEVMKQASPNS